MKFITIIDCNKDKHEICCDFIYKLTSFVPSFGDLRPITVVHLSHKNDNYVFSEIKTYEPIPYLQKRLELNNNEMP